MKQVATTDIRGKMILLGTGTSVGVPAIGCGCDVCTSSNPRNVRTRCSVVFGLEQGNLLIDTPPDLRHQLLREKIGIIHSVLYTHEHADHIGMPFHYIVKQPSKRESGNLMTMRLAIRNKHTLAQFLNSK